MLQHAPERHRRPRQEPRVPLRDRRLKQPRCASRVPLRSRHFRQRHRRLAAALRERPLQQKLSHPPPAIFLFFRPGPADEGHRVAVPDEDVGRVGQAL